MAKKLTAPVLIVDSPERCADLKYAMGFSAPDPVVFLVRGRDRYLVVPPMEFGRARAQCRRLTVLTPEMMKLPRSARRRLSGWALGLLDRLRLRRVIVSASFPLGVARRIERAGIRVSVAKAALFPRRACKAEAEIRKIRQAQRAAVAAMRAAVSLIAQSRAGADGYLRIRGQRLTSDMVRARISEVLLAHDCVGKDTIVAGGVSAADPHSRGEGPLRAGEAIVIDIFPQHAVHGYWGDLTRTVVRGPPCARLARMYRAVTAAQIAALRQVKAGAATARVHRAVVEEFERRGFRNSVVKDRPSGFIHGTGHGVGLEVHEAPSVSGAPGRLRRGHVITIEPGLYYPDIGGIRIEDTVVVTAGGWKYLASYRKRFRV